jgi:hypothetical protein
MMLNNKYVITWTYYNRTISINVAWNSQLSLRNYNTCILFIPSEVTVELVKIIADHELCSQFTTTTKLLYLIHTISLSPSRIHVGSEQVIKMG